MNTGAGEPEIVAALLCGNPPPSRNRNFELLSSETGRRARRRANFLRSLAKDVARTRERGGTVTIDRGPFQRGQVRLSIHRDDCIRRAYLTLDEVTLIARAFPLAARVLNLDGEQDSLTER
jgi:hypothetical protein